MYNKNHAFVLLSLLEVEEDFQPYLMNHTHLVNTLKCRETLLWFDYLPLLQLKLQSELEPPLKANKGDFFDNPNKRFKFDFGVFLRTCICSFKSRSTAESIRESSLTVHAKQLHSNLHQHKENITLQ